MKMAMDYNGGIMSYKNLEGFINKLEEAGELKRIKVEVDPVLEITEITDRISKAGGPALLFEKVKGSEYPLLINAMGSYKRMALALGVEELKDIGDTIGEFMDMSNYLGLMKKIKSLPRLSRLAAVFPLKLPGKGVCQEVIDENPDLEKLPVLKCWPLDGGRFITLPLVFTKDLDEMMFAGFLRKMPVTMVKSVTNDIFVPAEAEFILEGYVDVNEELHMEGPFGDHTGYYSLEDYYPVFHVTCITHRKKPVYQTTIVGKPPMEDCYMGKATEKIFLPLLKMTTPEIVDINFPLEGVFHSCVIISIHKRYPGHAAKVMNAVWGMGQMMYTKMVIVVDQEVDVQNVSTVMWKVFNNIDGKRDITISEGPLDALDHASNTPHYGSRVGIDATRKWPGEGHTRKW